MLINFSNKHSSSWNEKKIQTTIEEFGWVEDIFLPDFTNIDIFNQSVDKYINECKHKFLMANIPVSQQAYNEAVLIQSEYDFRNFLVKKLKEKNIRCIKAIFKEKVNPEFVRFEEYI